MTWGDVGNKVAIAKVRYGSIASIWACCRRTCATSSKGLPSGESGSHGRPYEASTGTTFPQLNRLARENPFGGSLPAAPRLPSQASKSVSVRVRSPLRQLRPSDLVKAWASLRPPCL